MYEEVSHLYRIDAKELKRIDASSSSRRVKREYIKQGYNIAMSLYGAFTDRETDKSFGLRIEILSNVPYTEKITYMILSMFEHIHPVSRYTIWIYDGDKEAIKCVGRYK